MKIMSRAKVGFRYVVLLFGVCLVGGPWIPVFAQRRILPPAENYDLSELGHRLDAVERLDVQRRLTVLETIQEESKEYSMWSKGSSVGTGLLLIKAVAETVKKKRDESEEE